jgi:hypothetical protein
MSITLIVQILAAVLLLLMGRRLYWFFVGAVGFIAATEWALMYFEAAPAWMVILIGLGVGLLGALLAVALRMAGFALAGLLGGGYLMLALTDALQVANPTLQWAVVGVGAVLGLILVVVLIDWALILISAITGAVFLARLLPVQGLVYLAAAVILAAVGVLVQSQIEPVAE